MTASIKDVLVEARKILFNHWCQGSFAVNDKGEDVLFSSLEAHGFDMSGGVRKAADILGVANTQKYVKALKILQTFAGYRLQESNDDKDTTKHKVLVWIDQAIADCTNKGI